MQYFKRCAYNIIEGSLEDTIKMLRFFTWIAKVVAIEGAAMTGVVGGAVGVEVGEALVWEEGTVLPVTTGPGHVVRAVKKRGYGVGVLEDGL